MKPFRAKSKRGPSTTAASIRDEGRPITPDDIRRKLREVQGDLGEELEDAAVEQLEPGLGSIAGAARARMPALVTVASVALVVGAWRLGLMIGARHSMQLEIRPVLPPR